MRKIKLPIQEQITEELMLDLIEEHRKEKSRILNLKEYYKNNNQVIMRRTQEDPNKPNNKLSHGYAKYITDTYCGYFMGEPVSYKSDNDNLLDELNTLFKYNDETDNNMSIAQEASICGYAYEILYMDEESNLRFKQVPTEEMIVVYDNSVQERMQFAIRYYDIYSLEDEGDLKEVILYTPNETIEYLFKYKNLEEKERYTHYFNDVPVSDYENNNYRTGDFEAVLPLIDAYDQANSDTANDFEYFTNALLVISGVTMEEEDEQGRPLNFKDNRVLNFIDPQSKAEYLIKNINDTALENYKDRLNRDIFRFSNVVDMTDEKFGGNLSGVAIRYKLIGMENVTGIKESKFKKGLLRRIELAIGMLNIKLNSEYLFTEIQPVFTRSIPVNENEIISVAKSLYGIISQKTLLSMMPFIEDPQEEMEAIAQEKEEQAVQLQEYSFNETTDTKVDDTDEE